LIPIRKGEYLYDDDRFRWAEPDVDQAARWMARLRMTQSSGRGSRRAAGTTSATASPMRAAAALMRKRLGNCNCCNGALSLSARSRACVPAVSNLLPLDGTLQTTDNPDRKLEDIAAQLRRVEDNTLARLTSSIAARRGSRR
jgi:hypothetical protein